MLALCRQFKCLPSQLYAEDVDFLMMLEIERLGGGGEDGGQHD